MKIDSCDFYTDESEVIADDLSDFSCSDCELSDSDGYFSKDIDIFPMRKHWRICYLLNSLSESDENDLDTEDELDWTETDEMPNLKNILGKIGVKVLSHLTNICALFRLCMDWLF